MHNKPDVSGLCAFAYNDYDVHFVSARKSFINVYHFIIIYYYIIPFIIQSNRLQCDY